MTAGNQLDSNAVRFKVELAILGIEANSNSVCVLTDHFSHSILFASDPQSDYAILFTHDLFYMQIRSRCCIQLSARMFIREADSGPMCKQFKNFDRNILRFRDMVR